MPTIDAAGTTIGYDEYGSGERVLLFVHGYLGSAGIWSPAAAALSDDHRCLCLDARGVGRSARPGSGYTVEQWGADVLAVADALGVDTFTYVGHSMGGLVGYHLAQTEPARLDALVGVCSAPAGPPRAGREAFTRFRAAWADGDATALAALLASTSVRLPDVGLTRRRGEEAVPAAAGHVDALLDGAAWPDLRPGLTAVRVPTLLVLGAADPALTTGLADYQLLPDAALHVMSGVGHVPQLEATDAFVAALRGFLADGPLTFATLTHRAAS